jgi:hypothetical protein
MKPGFRNLIVSLERTLKEGIMQYILRGKYFLSLVIVLTCLSVMLVGCCPPLPEPASGTGNLKVNMAGLPGPWAKEGYVEVAGPNNYKETLFSSEVPLIDLEPGQYTVTPKELTICSQTYIAAPTKVNVDSNKTSTTTISYSGAAVNAQGFRGGVVGTNTDEDETTGEVNFILDEKRQRLHTYGCVKRSGRSLTISDVRIFEGNVKNDFIFEFQRVTVVDLSNTEKICANEFQCVEYIFGSPELSKEQITKLSAGEYYLGLDAETLARRLLTQIMPSEGPLPNTGKGGTLDVRINVDEVPVALQNRAYICIEGYFKLDIVAGAANVLGRCVTQNESFDDIYAGTYKVIEPFPPSIITDDANPGTVYVPTFESSPTEVRVGESKTIIITYKAQASSALR